MINAAIRQTALEHAKRCDPLESCGLVVLVKRKLTYWPAQNIAADPATSFILDPQAIRDAETGGDVVGIVHSHVTTTADASPEDRASCNAHGVDWHIVQARTGDWFDLKPDTAPPALIGRPWVWAAADCWILVRDWYAQHGISLPTFQHPDTPEAFEADPLFDRYWEDAGFYEVSLSSIRYGDVTLLNIRGTGPNHIGVVDEDGLILHHPRNCLSGREPYTEWLRKATHRVVRHRDFTA